MKLSILYLIAAINSFVTPEARIAGGEEAEPFKYNWLVRIVKNGEHGCSGILLSDSTLLTASHCSKESRFNYEVEVHRHNLELSPEEEHSQIIKVKSIDRHDKYDVAVWRLSKPVVGFNSTIELDRGDGDDLVESDKVLTMGWGWARSGGPFSSKLQEVELPIFNTAKCGLTWLLRDRVVEPGFHYCAGGKGGKDACVGDSGGPLLVSRGNRTILVGITSFGQPCAHYGIPSVWTRVSPFIQFIEAAQQ